MLWVVTTFSSSCQAKKNHDSEKGRQNKQPFWNFLCAVPLTIVGYFMTALGHKGEMESDDNLYALRLSKISLYNFLNNSQK